MEIYPMDKKGYAVKELEFLRQELHSLKSCQITFLTFSITATALLLGIDANTEGVLVRVLPLSPLLILIQVGLLTRWAIREIGSRWKKIKELKSDESNGPNSK